MADKKISELDAITGANTAATDVFVVVDTSTGQTKKITREELNNAIEQDVLDSIDIDTINGDFTVTGTVTADGLTVEQNVGSKVTLKSTDTVIVGGEVIGDIEFFSSDASGVGAAARANITVEAADAAGRGHMYFKTSTGGELPINRMLIQGGGDISFYEDTGTTAKLFWDASAEALGIGTTSPDANSQLHIKKTGANAKITLETDESNDCYINFSGATSEASIGYEPTSNAIVFANAADGLTSNERMRIDNSGRVGLGNSSPTYKLDVLDNDSGSVITRIKNSNAGTGARAGIFLDNDGGNLMALYATSSTYTGVSSWTDAGVISTSSAASGGLIFNSQSSGGIKFQTGTTERMRIDSAGNVLVGTTDTSLYNNGAGGDTGVVIEPSGTIQVAKSSNACVLFNRLDSDGIIAGFRKDGAQVGSIGVNGSSLTVGRGSSGVHFYDGGTKIIVPANPSTGGDNDATVDLGYSSSRFRNLFLSSGVYLGGTGSANHLDDYEEGTWTPTLTSNGTAPTITSYGNRVGKYTKVGDMLYVACFIRATLSAAGTGTPRVSGFPFNTIGGVYQPVYTGLITLLNNGTDAQPYSISANYVQFDGGTSYVTGGNAYLCFSAVFKVSY